MNKIKYLILIFFISIFTLSSTPQVKIGYKPNEIKLDFPNKEIETKYNNQGYKELSIKMDRILLIYIFDKNDLSFITVIVPDNSFVLNEYINMFNTYHTRTDEDKWIKTSLYGLLEIKLIKNKHIYFIIYIK